MLPSRERPPVARRVHQSGKFYRKLWPVGDPCCGRGSQDGNGVEFRHTSPKNGRFRTARPTSLKRFATVAEVANKIVLSVQHTGLRDQRSRPTGRWRRGAGHRLSRGPAREDHQDERRPAAGSPGRPLRAPGVPIRSRRPGRRAGGPRRQARRLPGGRARQLRAGPQGAGEGDRGQEDQHGAAGAGRAVDRLHPGRSHGAGLQDLPHRNGAVRLSDSDCAVGECRRTSCRYFSSTRRKAGSG